MPRKRRAYDGIFASVKTPYDGDGNVSGKARGVQARIAAVSCSSLRSLQKPRSQLGDGTPLRSGMFVTV